MSESEFHPIGQRAGFQQLVDHMEGIAFWTSTELGRFDFVSEGFEDIWGFPAAEAVKDIDRMMAGVHEEDREPLLNAIGRVVETGTEQVFEHRVVQPEGTVKWVSARVFPRHDDSGDFVELIGVSTDVTPIKHREEELEVLNRILRHDVRNDMNVVLGWLSTIEDEVEGEARDALDRAVSASRHVVELTELAREYVQVVIEDGDFELESIDIATALEGEIVAQRESYPEADFRIDGELPDVAVAANELVRSVFRNLLVNAVQHNDTETPVVTVSASVEGERVRVAIADNGPGIADDVKPRLFGKGERGLDSEGMGMGLYLSNEEVEGFGGSIRVADNEPRGAVFVVELPRADVEP